MDSRLKVLETLYRFDLDEAAHIALVQDAVALCWQNRDPIVLISARLQKDSRVELSPMHVVRENRSDHAKALQSGLQHVSIAEYAAISGAAPFYGSAAEARHRGQLDNPESLTMARQAGINDCIGLFSGTQECGVIGVMTLANEPRKVTQREEAYWQPVADHLAAAWRLRHRIDDGASAESLADAVFRADGRCIGEVNTRLQGPVRQRLRDHVLRREHERTERGEHQRLWPELVCGQWTFVDHFETSGRRVVLALRNTPTGASLCQLTSGEARALSGARKGTSNKELCIDMGISAASVTRLLQSATRKINMSLANLMHFMPADAVRCRTLLFGTQSISVLSEPAVARWRDDLSEAEVDVVTAVLRGSTNREIARDRARSVRTVVNQLASAFEKMGVHSRRELVSRCSGYESEERRQPPSNDE